MNSDPGIMAPSRSFIIKGVERLGHPQHSLDAVLCARRQQDEKLMYSRFSLCQCVFTMRFSHTNLHCLSFPLLLGAMCV